MVQNDEGRDDGVKRMIRSFRASVSAELEDHRGRFDRLDNCIAGTDVRVTELGTNMRTMETAILNAISELGRHVVRLEDRIEEHLRRDHGDAA